MTAEHVATYTVTGMSADSGRQASITAAATSIRFDGTAAAGPELPSPADLLCAALAACILKNVERFSHILHFQYTAACVRVTADRLEPPPHIAAMRYELQVATAETPERLDLLHRNIQRHGTIANTLAAACLVTGTITAVEPTAAA